MAVADLHMACLFIPLHDSALILVLSMPHWWLHWLIGLRYATAPILSPHALTKNPCRSMRFLLPLVITAFATALANCMRFWLLVAILSPVWGSCILLNWVSVDVIQALITSGQNRRFVPVLALNALQLFPRVLRRHSSASVTRSSGRAVERRGSFLKARCEEKIEEIQYVFTKGVIFVLELFNSTKKRIDSITGSFLKGNLLS